MLNFAQWTWIIWEKSPYHSLTPVGPILNQCKRLISTVDFRIARHPPGIRANW